MYLRRVFRRRIFDPSVENCRCSHDRKKNIAKMGNCPDITIWTPVFVVVVVIVQVVLVLVAILFVVIVAVVVLVVVVLVVVFLSQKSLNVSKF